ncbi:ABC transporter substrate-binding protein [Patulibacter sp. S7RM1-6]
MRTKLWAAALPLLAAGAIAGCGSDGDSSASSGDAEPLKVVIIPPSSGALAVFGRDARKAWEFAAEEANAKGGVDGHKVELVTAQTDGTPAATVRAARKAATQDGAHFIGAVMTSPEHGALQQQLKGMGSISINSLGKDDPLTGEQCSPNAFRAIQNTQMDINAIAATLAKLPAKKWAIQAVDYATGHTSAKIFTAAAKKAGKQVVLTQYAPLNTTEFGSYISKLKSSDADGLFAVEYGADGSAFVTQGAQFKLFDEFKTVVGFNMVSEPLFKALGDKIVGFYNNVGYAHTLDNPKNAAFVKAWKAKEGEEPYYVEADNYIAAQLLFEGVRKAGSVDPEKVEQALGSVSFDTIVGPVSMRPQDHQIQRPSYLGQVVKKDGKLAWKILADVPASRTTPQPDPACKIATR